MSKGMKTFAGKIDKCKDCQSDLNHNHYTEEELKNLKSKGMTLGKNQRVSFCEKCETIYINSKS